MELRPHHVGIIVKDLQKALEFYTNCLGCSQVTEVFTIDRPDYGVKYAFVGTKEGNGMLIELLEPQRGVYVDMMKEKGEGLICEFCFLVDDMGAFYDEMTKKGVPLEDRSGNVLKDRKGDRMESTGNRIAYLRAEGTWVEILEQCGRKIGKA